MRMVANGVTLDLGEYRQQLVKGVPSLAVIRQVQERTGLPLAKARDMVWQMIAFEGLAADAAALALWQASLAEYEEEDDE